MILHDIVAAQKTYLFNSIDINIALRSVRYVFNYVLAGITQKHNWREKTDVAKRALLFTKVPKGTEVE